MNAYSQYQKNQVISASPEQILLLLHDGAIRFINQAVYGFEEENLTLFHHGISKAMAIITEFSNSLDHTIGGEIATNLDALYNFMIRELTQANLYKDVEKLRVVEKLLVDLRTTWREAIKINKNGQVPVSQLLSIPKAPYQNSAPEDHVPLSVTR